MSKIAWTCTEDRELRLQTKNVGDGAARREERRNTPKRIYECCERPHADGRGNSEGRQKIEKRKVLWPWREQPKKGEKAEDKQ